MSRIRTTFVTLGLALALTGGAFQAHAKKGDAQEKPKKEAVGLVGIVLKVEAPHLIIKTFGKTGGEVKVVTNSQTTYAIEGTPAKIEEIKPGHRVVVTPATGTAQKILVHDDLKKDKKKKKDA
jgi:uncharacterized protein YndB with AHSA1/START domain